MVVSEPVVHGGAERLALPERGATGRAVVAEADVDVVGVRVRAVVRDPNPGRRRARSGG